MSGGPIMVFHYPQRLDDDPRVGSSARVVRMHRAFRDAGFDVHTVAGDSTERLRRIRDVRRLVRAGSRVEFVYSEATTNPTAMNDAHHLPLRPLADARFLLFMRRHGVPVGLFYRDVHWQFEFYRALVPAFKRWVARAWYLFDVWWYRLALDVMFLPSRSMAAHIPAWRHSARVVDLPPASAHQIQPYDPHQGELRLFYVGSVVPPLYDISDLIRAVESTSGVLLRICCPVGQASIVEDAASCSRISVVHEHGDALAGHYQWCDVACLVYPHHPYRDFSMPVKLFEAIGYGRPVLVSGGREVNRFVATTQSGWVVELSQLDDVLVELRDNVDRRIEAAERAVVASERNTWTSRAKTVADVLTEGQAMFDRARSSGEPRTAHDSSAMSARHGGTA